SGVDASTTPTLDIGAGARVSGAGVILDSTQATNLNASATLSGRALALDSGQITLSLSGAGTVPASSGLVLSGAALQSLPGAQSLSLLSYSSIDIYGSGAIGTLDAAGQPTLTNLALHAGGIRGFNTGGGTVSFSAKNVLLDNSAAARSAGASGPVGGSL